MKKQILTLSVIALLTASIHANCDYNSCGPCAPAPCAVAPCVAPCQPCCMPSCWYWAARGALTWHNDLKFNSRLHNMGNLRLDYKVGGSASLALGYYFTCLPCFRIELEALYQRNSLKSATFNNLGINLAPSNGTHPANGANSDFALMANLFYDYDLGCCFKVYLGAGLGVSRTRIRFSTLTMPPNANLNPSDFGPISTHTFALVGSEVLAAAGFTEDAAILANIVAATNHTYFAWNVMGGLTYALSPCWNLDLGYRLFAKTKLKINQQAGYNKPNIPLISRLELGLRYNF